MNMKLRWSGVLSLVSLATASLVGCTAGSEVATPTSGPGTATASVTPSPTTAAKISKSQADSLVAQVALPTNALTTIGDFIEPTKSDTTLTNLTSVCGWSRQPRINLSARTTIWNFDGIEVVQTVVAYESAEADAVLAESRRDMARCEPPVVFGNYTADQYAEQMPPTYPGVADEYGFSFRVNDGGKVTYEWEIQVGGPDRHLVADVYADAFDLSDAKSAALKAATLQATRVAAISLSQ
jgi:hypothetical protein